MLASPKVRETGVLQERLIAPIKSQSSQSRESRMNKERPEPPKQALSRVEIVQHMVAKLKMTGEPPATVRRLAEFAMSAANHTSAPVRKQVDKIQIRISVERLNAWETYVVFFQGERLSVMLYKHSGDQTGKVRDALARASEGPDGIKNRNQVKKSARFGIFPQNKVNKWVFLLN